MAITLLRVPGLLELPIFDVSGSGSRQIQNLAPAPTPTPTCRPRPHRPCPQCHLPKLYFF